MIILSAAILCSCGNIDYLKKDRLLQTMAFPLSGAGTDGDDALSATTNMSDKDDIKAPKLNAYEGAAYVRPPQINNYGTVNLAYAIEVPPGRKGVQPSVGLSYSSSGGDGLVGIGWSLSTGLGVISRATKNGQLYYDHRDTFTFNGQRLVKTEGSSGSEDGVYRLEIESGFSKFILSNAESGGVWRVIDKAGTVATLGETRSSRIYRPDDTRKTYSWNFCKSVDLNGNFMTASYDDSSYGDNHILYLKEIRYTGNEGEGMPARQFVRFTYRDRDEAYVSKAAGFIMRMDRLLDRITVGWDDPNGFSETELWSYKPVYEVSADSGRPLLKTVETERETTKPEFFYQEALHSFSWAVVDNNRAGDPEENPDMVKYFEGDFNGDGISDMVFFNPSTGDWRAMEGNRGGGYFERYYGKKFQGYDGPDRIQWFKGNVTGDYNGDGRSDIAFYLPETREFWVAEHDGRTFDFHCYGKLSIGIDIFTCEWFTGDFDGNGLSDTVLFNEPTGQWVLMANRGGAFDFLLFSEHFKNLFRYDYAPDISLNSPSTADRSDMGRDRDKISFISGDYNGDGRTDISFYDARSGKWWVAENFRVASTPLGNRGATSFDATIDFKLEWKVYKEFTEREKEQFAPGADSLGTNDRFSGDFNGDGFSDFLIFHRDRGEWVIGETGDGNIRFRVYSRTPQFREITRWIQGDFNGDGRTDIGFFSKTDNNFWVGEATADGFRYRVYSNLAGGPDPGRVLASAPLPRDEVRVIDAKAIIAGSAATAVADYQYDGNYYAGSGEKAFAGYFTSTSPELLIYNKKEKRIYLKQGSADTAMKLGVDLESDGAIILNGEKPGRYRDDRDGILYYRKNSSFGSNTHRFGIVHYNGSAFIDTTAALFDRAAVTDFDIAKSFYLADRFRASDTNRHILVLDDKADTPRFVLFTGNGTFNALAVSGVSASIFANLRERRNFIRFFSGSFTDTKAQVLFVDMTGAAHAWYLGTITGGSIVFTELSGNPRFISEGFIEPCCVRSAAAGAELVYGKVENGIVTFLKLNVGPSSINQTTYVPLAEGNSFKGEFDHLGNPVVRGEGGLKRVVLGVSCVLEDLNASITSLKRPDLLTKVYPFQWIQGDYNGDGKTDIGIFHLKERHWYFALTGGTVPDLVSVVKNGIGGIYRMTYENSTRFDNTDEEGIPRLPMNYKVCVKLVVEDGLGRDVATEYEYAGGYAFSAFIDGEKETDFFGFSSFTVIDAHGRRTESEYHTAPYDDYRKNRALAGAVKIVHSYGADRLEYGRTEHDYRIYTIEPSPPAPLPGGEGRMPRSYLIEPTAARKYVKDVLAETRTSEMDLVPGRYEMRARTENVTDHYNDGIHREVTVASYIRFENNDETNEMRVDYAKGFADSSHETTTSYEYDGRGNVTRETARYTGSSLAAVSDRIMEYSYDGYGNRVRTVNASGSPVRITEKSYDSRLRQFVTEERSLGDITLTTKHDINYQSAFGGLNGTVDPNGNGTYFEYDGQGRLVKERIDADTGTETLQAYEYGTVFPLSAKVTQFDSFSTLLGGGTIETRVYSDGMGRVIHTVRSAAGGQGCHFVKTGLVAYDATGRVIRTSQAAWAADDEINIFRRNLNEKNPTVKAYDAAGRVSKITLPEGYSGEGETSISYAYNDPWEVAETHSVGRSKRTVKNARGLVLYVEDSGKGDDGRSVVAKIGFAYDIAGNRVKKMDLMTPPSPGGGVTGMSTDVPENLFRPGIKDTSGANVACWRYNAFGQVTESSDPDLGYSRIEYNSFGDAAARTDALGRVTTFSYDRLGRMVEKNLPGDEGIVKYAYDTLPGSENALGRMVAMDDPAQLKEFSYDRIGRVKSEFRLIKGAGIEKFQTDFTYDLLSRKKSIIYPEDPKTKNHMTVTYGYCAMGVKSIAVANGDASKTIISDIAYNEFGQMTEVRRGNGTVTSYSYDIKGRMASLLTTANHNGKTWKVQDVKYQFKVDNSIAVVQNTPDVAADGACQTNVRYEYSYDGLNRLVRAKGDYDKVLIAPTEGAAPPPDPLSRGARGSVSKKFELGYGYTQNGNLIAKTIYNTDTGAVDDRWNYAYSNHAATAITASRSSAGYTMGYDAAGNMVSQADHGRNLAKEMAYDSYNRIRRITDPRNGNVKGEYWYDDQGFRVRKKSRMDHEGMEKEVEILNPSMYFNVEITRDLLGNAQENTGYGVNNIYLNGVRVAAVLPNGNAQYYLTDQVDSVKVVTNDAGIVVTSHEYLPFGEDWITEGDTKNAPKFNSQELDKESGYYFYNARHYDPEIARFVTADTVIDGEIKDKNGKIITSDTQGWNRFAYCRNNPIRYSDPTGHEAQPSGLDLSKGFSALKEKVGNTINNITSTVNKTYESAKQVVTDKIQQAKNSITERLGGKSTSSPVREQGQGLLLQTDRALNQSDTAMQSHGCYFRACQAVAERYAGKRLSADDIKSSREALTKSGAIGQGDYALNVNNPDQVINDAFERLGVKKTATVGYGGKPDQKRDFTIVAGHTEFPSGAAGDHKRLGDANGNEIWDPAPGGKKSSSRTIDVFLHDKK
ncbi:MAG: hypothetical protein KA369_13655 [Spirochaetes bacterium]|nr:hypothetical protein [Spirochaetota bacterium]